MADKNKQDDTRNLGFEEAIRSLTDIVEKIESGDTPLQSSLEQYEKGMALIKHCRGILQAAEKRIEKISADHRPIDDQPESIEPDDSSNDQDTDEDALF